MTDAEFQNRALPRLPTGAQIVALASVLGISSSELNCEVRIALAHVALHALEVSNSLVMASNASASDGVLQNILGEDAVTEEAAEAAYPWHRVVCIGACMLEGKKKGNRWAFVNNDETLRDEFAMTRKWLSSTPGVIYNVPTDGTHFTTAKAKYLGTWKDAEQLMRWRVEHDVRLSRERAETDEKAGKQTALRAAMRPLDELRRLYNTTDTMGRILIEAQLISYLRRGSL